MKTQKQQEQEKIKKDTEEFLKAGGKVQILPSYVDQPNRPAQLNIDYLGR